MASGQEVILSSGNILVKSIAWNRGAEQGNDEVYESLRSCFEGANEVVQRSHGGWEVIGEDNKTSKEETDRQDLKVSLKVFLYSSEKHDIIAAIDKGLKLTNVDSLDSLIVTFSGHSIDHAVSLDEAKAVWLILEEIVASGKVKVIGLSDVDTELFVQLHRWSKVKPGIIQINLASCCVVPPELAEFCKKEGIQLLTHSDPVDALPREKLDLIIQSMRSQENLTIATPNTLWDLKWVLRYQVHLKCRGVLATKGYGAALHQAAL